MCLFCLLFHPGHSSPPTSGTEITHRWEKMSELVAYYKVAAFIFHHSTGNVTGFALRRGSHVSPRRRVSLPHNCYRPAFVWTSRKCSAACKKPSWLLNTFDLTHCRSHVHDTLYRLLFVKAILKSHLLHFTAQFCTAFCWSGTNVPIKIQWILQCEKCPKGLEYFSKLSYEVLLWHKTGDASGPNIQIFSGLVYYFY